MLTNEKCGKLENFFVLMSNSGAPARAARAAEHHGVRKNTGGPDVVCVR